MCDRRPARCGTGPSEIGSGNSSELGMSWILPMLPTLNRVWPHIQFDLYFGSGPDLAERVKALDVHCAVTSRVFVEPVFEVIRLVSEDYAFVGSDALLQRQPFDDAADAGAHTLVDVQPEKPLFRYFRDALAAPELPPFGSQRIMGTTAAVRQFILNGEGVGVLPRYLVEDDLRSGTLRRLFPSVELLFDHFRLMYRRDDPRAELYRNVAAVMGEQPLT